MSGALAAILLVSVAATPGSAQPKPGEIDAEAQEILAETLALAPKSPPSPDDAFGRWNEARAHTDEMALARLLASGASDRANVESFDAALRQNAAQAAVDAATKVRDAARDELAAERERLSDLTVRAFVVGGDHGVERYEALINGDTTDPQAGRDLMFSQVLTRQEQVTGEAQRASNIARQKLMAARARLAKAKAEAAVRAANAQRLAEVRAGAAAAHEQAIADTATAATRLRSTRRGGIVPQEVTLIGLPRLTAEDLAGWFAGTWFVPRVSTPISDFARWFIDEGAAEGIRGDIAFAQAVLETGGFSNNDSISANNFSGIGHCDTCGSGWRFPSPQMGVRAQIQLLKSYAIRGPDYVNPMVDRRLRGPAGCCSTWGELTTVWATDPTYGPKVMEIYSSIVDYAIGRRAAGQGFDDPRPTPVMVGR